MTDILLYCHTGIAIMTVKNVSYPFIIHNISKSEAINLFKNSFREDWDIYKQHCLKFLTIQSSFFNFFV